jgi:tRNA(adenine34) deaminase
MQKTIRKIPECGLVKTITMITDTQWMEQAFLEAEKALNNKEVPVGAVIVHQGRIVGRGYNQIEMLQDATAHAEIIAISAAAGTLGTWRLNECDLYVTLEPCMMCCGAILLSRFHKLVFGAADPRFGAVVSTYQLLEDNKYNQPIQIVGGILAGPCSEILKEFFKSIRKKK